MKLVKHTVPGIGRRVLFITNILIGKLVREAYTLWLMLYRFSVDNCVLESLDNAPVDCVALVGVVSIVVILQTSNPRRVCLRSLRLYTLLNGAQQARSSLASSLSVLYRLGPASVFPTYSRVFMLAVCA